MKLKKFSIKQLYIPQTCCINTLKFPRVQSGLAFHDTNISLLNLMRTEKSLYSSKSTQTKRTLLSKLSMREGNKMIKVKDVDVNTPKKKKNLSAKEVDLYHYHICLNQSLFQLFSMLQR